MPETDSSNIPEGWSPATEVPNSVGDALYQRSTAGGTQYISFDQGTYKLHQDGYSEPITSDSDLNVVALYAEGFATIDNLKVRDLTPQEFADEIAKHALLAFGGFLGEEKVQKARTRIHRAETLLFELRSRLLELAPESFDARAERVCEDARQGIYNAYKAIELGEFHLAKHVLTFAATALGECANDLDEAEEAAAGGGGEGPGPGSN